VVRVDPSTARKATLVEAAGAAAMDADGSTLVFEASRGSLQSLDLRTGTRSAVPEARGLLPVRAGSLADSGADRPDGAVLLAPDGIVGTGETARVANPTAGQRDTVGEADR
jgi:hypothetical protein